MPILDLGPPLDIENSPLPTNLINAGKAAIEGSPTPAPAPAETVAPPTTPVAGQPTVRLTFPSGESATGNLTDTYDLDGEEGVRIVMEDGLVYDGPAADIEIEQISAPAAPKPVQKRRAAPPPAPPAPVVVPEDEEPPPPAAPRPPVEPEPVSPAAQPAQQFEAGDVVEVNGRRGTVTKSEMQPRLDGGRSEVISGTFVGGRRGTYWGGFANRLNIVKVAPGAPAPAVEPEPAPAPESVGPPFDPLARLREATAESYRVHEETQDRVEAARARGASEEEILALFEPLQNPSPPPLPPL